MKKLTIILLTILALVLSACGSSASTPTISMAARDPATATLTTEMQLLLGTLKLEGTEQAVTAEQAAELLPLWQVYQSLLESDTTAQAETDALVKQIEDTMTDEQMQAIKDMGLTPQDSFAIMQEMGIGMGGQAQSSDSQSGADNFMPPGGGAPPDMGEGGPGGAPGQMPGGQSLSQEQIATAQASRSQRGGGNFLPPGLLDALIQYLQEIAGQ
jgi:hypothetical protein